MKHKKLTRVDVDKINARLASAIEAFNWYSPSELKDIYWNNKMSSTDQKALMEVLSYKLKTAV